MMQHQTLEHRFVKHFPEPLEPGILYVSLDYASVAHSCCCGCGEEVITPLTPTDWKLTFDGETISLWPSIGSWTLTCRSHYVIDKSQVRVAERWSDAQIEAERKRDHRVKTRHYESDQASTAPSPQSQPSEEPVMAGWLRRLLRFMFG